MLERAIRQRRTLFIISDLLCTAAAFWGAYLLRFHAGFGASETAISPWDEYAKLTIPVCLIWLFAYQHSGLYQPDQGRSAFAEFRRFLRAGLVGVIILFALTYALRVWIEPSRIFIAWFFVGAIVLPMAGRAGLRRMVSRWLARGASVRRVLVVGANHAGRTLAEGIREHAVGFLMVGFLDDEKPRDAEVIPGLRVLGRTSEVEECVRKESIDEVIIARMPGGSHEKQARYMDRCLALEVVWKIVPSQYEMLLDRISVDEVAGIPLIGMKTSNIIGLNYAVKRAFDVAISLVLIIFSLPLMIVTAIAIKLTSRGPIVYKQERVGYKQRPFQFMKFRSMVADADKKRDELKRMNERQGPVFKIRNDPRITPVGRLIRKFSIDELPQLFLVLRGEMSLIGPRPPLPDEVAEYEEWQKRRLDAPPGITGLWQVSGRTRLSFEEMVQLDLYYIENWSLMLDLKLALQTVRVVLFGLEH